MTQEEYKEAAENDELQKICIKERRNNLFEGTSYWNL